MRLLTYYHSELGQPCRNGTRPAIANERLSVNRARQVIFKLKTPYRNGTMHIVMSPMKFMQRLAALVPRPRLHLIRFHEVLAPNAKLRFKVMPAPVQATTAGAFSWTCAAQLSVGVAACGPALPRCAPCACWGNGLPHLSVRGTIAGTFPREF